MDTSSKTSPVDLVHLSQQTMHDKEVERDVLDLFVQQADRSLAELATARDDSDRKAIAHRLRGAARGIGANAVAAAAQSVEDDPGGEGAMAGLRAAIAEAADFIAGMQR